MARKSRKIAVSTEINAEALYVNTALYIRLSVEDNKNRGNSIETQKMVLENYLEGKPEFVVYDTYIDNGCTGTNFLRPAFQKMLADIEAGKVNCVLIKDLSRLGRNSIDTGYYMEQYFPANKVRFISVADQYDSEHPDNMNGGIILPLKNMINEAYSLDIGRKITAQARQAMKDGDYVGGRAPYGYRKDPDNCHKLLVDEEASAVVRQIFQWAYEKVGINDIVKRLNAANILTPSFYKKKTGEISHENLLGSGVWQTRTVAKILNTEIYTGDMVQGKLKTVDHRRVPAEPENIISVPNTHEPVVSREIFDAVKAFRQQVAEDSKRRKVKPYTPNIFKGKVFCEHCGGSLHRQRNTLKTMPDAYFFHCLTNSRIKKGGCEGVLIDERKLMPIVMDIMKEKLAAALGEYANALHGADEHIALLEEKLHESRVLLLEQRQFSRRMYEDLAKGILTDDDYSLMKERSEKKIAVVSAEISDYGKAIAALRGQSARYMELRSALTTLNRSKKLSVEMVQKLIERIEITHGHEISVAAAFEGELQSYSGAWGKCVNM